MGIIASYLALCGFALAFVLFVIYPVLRFANVLPLVI